MCYSNREGLGRILDLPKGAESLSESALSAPEQWNYSPLDEKLTYSAPEYPFDRHSRLMSDGALKKAFRIVMELKSVRIQAISDLLFKAHGVRITPSSTNDEINRLPALIGSLGRLKKLTNEQIESRLTTLRALEDNGITWRFH